MNFQVSVYQIKRGNENKEERKNENLQK